MAKDIYHEQVRKALEKEGWLVTSDPLSFRVGGVGFRIDLGAEKVMIAQKENEKIAVEIKTFIQQSQIHAFYEALAKVLYHGKNNGDIVIGFQKPAVRQYVDGYATA